MILLFDEDTGGCEFLGFRICQNKLAPGIWSKAIAEIIPARIVEIGTGEGGWTSLIGIAAQNIGAIVRTFDINDNQTDYRTWFESLPIESRISDCFQTESDIGSIIASPGATLLLCDGGNKPREFNTFAKYLKPGDVIAAHDYVASNDFLSYWAWSEITTKDVAQTVTDCGLVPFMQSDMNKAAWLAFQKQ